jgi:hypothetical protein
MRTIDPRPLALAAVLLFAACASQMQPAKQALEDATAAVGAAAIDAGVYMSDKLVALQNRLADIRNSFDRKDYAAVLTGAPGVTTDAKSLEQAAAAKKQQNLQELASEWSGLASSVPNQVGAIRARIETLDKHKQATAGIDLSTAKADLVDATSLWSKAQASHNANQDEDAVNTAETVKAKLESAADALRLSLPVTKVAAK